MSSRPRFGFLVFFLWLFFFCFFFWLMLINDDQRYNALNYCRLSPQCVVIGR